jgi:transcriptional regulator with XRE-family HTH domain
MTRKKEKEIKINPRSTNQDHKLIGQKLRAARLKKGVSQEALAKELGISFQQVQKYEKGVNRIEITRIMAIAKLLDVDLEHFTGTIEMKRSAATINFDDILATREGVQIIKAMIDLNVEQRQFLIDVARRLPQLAAA